MALRNYLYAKHANDPFANTVKQQQQQQQNAQQLTKKDIEDIGCKNCAECKDCVKPKVQVVIE